MNSLVNCEYEMNSELEKQTNELGKITPHKTKKKRKDYRRCMLSNHLFMRKGIGY